MKQLTRVFLACILASCSKSHTPTVVHSSRISVIPDISDSMACIPAADPILALYGFENNKDQEAHFRLILISDKKLNPAEEINIDDGVTSEQKNENQETDYREQLVNAFYDEVRNTIADFRKHYIPCAALKHSECFATIAGELELLAGSKAAQRTLIIFSDLQENTDVFSCYTPQGQCLLQTNPEKVAKLLLQRCPLPDNLVGVTVYFVYNPCNRDQDIMFGEMVAIYKQLLHARGARIVIQATNKNFDL